MAGYGTVRTWARLLGYEEAGRAAAADARRGEGETDLLLTDIAESQINIDAEDGGDESEKAA